MGFVQDVKRARDELEWSKTAVPEWPDKDGNPRVIYAKPMTMNHLRLVDLHGQKKKSVSSRLVKLAQLAFCDADGRRLISLNEIDDFEATVDPEVLNRVLEELGLFNTDEIEAFEAAEKNSATTLDDD